MFLDPEFFDRFGLAPMPEAVWALAPAGVLFVVPLLLLALIARELVWPGDT